MGFYGVHQDESLTEASPAGNDFLASVCVEWEREALAAASATRVVTIRTGLALDRSGGALPQIARPFSFFAGGPMGSGHQYMSWIHRDDWVRMVHWAMTNAQVSGPLNAAAPNPVTNREFAKTLGRVLRRPAFVTTPPFALRLALGEMADALLLSGQRILPAKAQSLGFTFRYPQLEPALRAIYRLEGQPLDRPVHGRAGDEHRSGNDHATTVPVASAPLPPDERECRGNHRQLTSLDAHVERQQRREELRARQAELLQGAGEAHAVQQAKCEDQCDPPRLEIRQQEILNRDVRDRDRDQRFDDRRRHRDQAVDAQARA